MLKMEFVSENYFRFQYQNLRAIGINLTRNDEIQISKRMIFLIVSLVFTIFGISCGSWENISSPEKLSESLAPCLQAWMALIKLFDIFLQTKPLTKLLQQLVTLTKRANNNEMEIIIEENKNDTKISGFYSRCCYLAMVLGTVAPFILMTIQYMQTGEFEHILPFAGKYFVDINKWPIFCLIFANILISLYLVGFTATGLDTLFSWYIHNIVAQFRLVQEKLTMMLKADIQNPSELARTIRSIIIHHQTAISIAKKFDELYRPIIFTQFSISSLQICMIAYQLVHGVAWANMPFLFIFLISVHTQMFIYCIGGQRLQNESLKLATNFYEAIQWTRCDISCRKLFLLPMIRSQKPCVITGIFFEVNMQLFAEVVRTAVSYIAILKSLEEKS